MSKFNTKLDDRLSRGLSKSVPGAADSVKKSSSDLGVVGASIATNISKAAGGGSGHSRNGICFFFNNSRGCNKGDKCRFSHKIDPTVAPRGHSRKKKCFFFNIPRGCNLGDQCPFRHEIDEVVAARVQWVLDLDNPIGPFNEPYDSDGDY